MALVRSKGGAAAQEEAYMDACKEGCRVMKGCEGFIVVPDDIPRCYRKGASINLHQLRACATVCADIDCNCIY